MTRPYRKWTSADIEFIRLNRSKMTVPEIAQSLGTTPVKIQGLINRQSIYKREKTEPILPNRNQLKELALKGYCYRSMVNLVEVIRGLNA
jgi:predicted transcriptional regulator